MKLMEMRKMKYAGLLILALAMFTPLAFGMEVTKKFKDKKKNFSIQLPKSWNVKELGDGKETRLVISREALIKPTDKYLVGVKLTKTERMRANHPGLGRDRDIVEFGINQLKKAVEEAPTNQEVRTGSFKSGDYNGDILERIIQTDDDDQPYHYYHVVLAYKGNMVQMEFKAPEKQWDNYKYSFNNGLSSVILK